MKPRTSGLDKSTRIATTPDKKYRVVMQDIKNQIISGQLSPGSPLPSWDEIGASFGVSRITVQRAMSELRTGGFIASRRRSGSFVSERPPNLFRIALIFGSAHENIFRRTVTQQFQEMQERTEYHVEVYRGVENGPESPAHRRLTASIRNGELAAMVLCLPSSTLERLPELAEAPLPKIHITDTPNPRVDTICFNKTHWISEAIDALKQEGRKTIAVMGTQSLLEQYAGVMTQAGLEIKPYLKVPVDVENPQGGQPLAELLMRLPRKLKPDGLIVAHDALAEHVQTGLIAAGTRVPQDLVVVAQCDWPRLVPSTLPIRWLGFDIAEVVELAMSRLVHNDQTLNKRTVSVVAYHMQPRFAQNTTD